MISRVADHCFWLGRYLERAEGTARVLQVTRNLSLDGALSPRSCWHPVVVVAGEEAPFLARFPSGSEDGELVQRYLSWDEENPTSIRRSVAAARENARSIREVVSLEVWEAVNELHLWLCREAELRWRADRHGFYLQVRHAIQLAQGQVQGTMLHEDPYDFIVLGVMLERAGQVARILDVHHHALAAEGAAHRVVETAVFLALLRACSGFEPFMKRQRGAVTPGAIASFLLLDPRFPRSVRFAVSTALDRLERVGARERSESLRRLRDLSAWLDVQQPGALGREDLHALLTRVVDGTAWICEAIGRELLGQAPVVAQDSQVQ